MPSGTGPCAKKPPIPHMALEREPRRVALEPFLQHEERPQAPAVAPAPGMMLVHHGVERRGTEKPAVRQAGERCVGLITQQAAEPFGKRRYEALLAAMDDLGRQELLGELLEEV